MTELGDRHAPVSVIAMGEIRTSWSNWPDLTRPQLAGFDLSTEGRVAQDHAIRVLVLK
jgi:hypothetical protein